MAPFDLFKKLMPIIVLIGYSTFGGWMFLQLEGDKIPDDVTANYSDMDLNISSVHRRMAIMNTDWSKVYEHLFSNLTDFYGNLKNKRTQDGRRFRQLQKYYKGKLVLSSIINQLIKDHNTSLLAMETFLETIIEEKNDSIAKYSEEQKSVWDMWSATLYAATLYTTIGYGNIAPKTFAGRLATMLYALVGIPMVLVILNDFGVALFETLKYLHTKYEQFIKRRNNWKPVNTPKDVSDLPLSAAIGLLIFWLCMSAAIFMIWEEWDYFTAFYFFFITLTTIGLGDVVPDYPAYTLMAFVLVLIGLSVVSMSFNIIQAKVENMFTTMMLNIDSEYRNMQIDPEHSKMTESQYMGGMGIMQLMKNKPLHERIILKLMGEHKKQMLEEHWEKKQNTRNIGCQTESKNYRTVDLQVDLDEEPDVKNKNNRPKMYIYNLGDD